MVQGGSSRQAANADTTLLIAGRRVQGPYESLLYTSCISLTLRFLRRICTEGLERPEVRPHSLQRPIEVLHRSRIRNADVLRCAEAFSGNRGHMRFVQKAMCDISRRVHAALPEERRHIRIRVERAFGHRALHTWDRAQAADD